MPKPPMFTKRHHDFLTENLGQVYRECGLVQKGVMQVAAEHLARGLEKDNPRFNAERFVRTILGNWSSDDGTGAPTP